MPTYEYSCSHCNRDIEIFHSITAPRVSICPECEKPGLTRRISGGAGLIFKGSGFYETDYKRKSGGEPQKAAEATPAKAPAGDSAGAATKSE